MNNNHSESKLKYKQRWTTSLLRGAIESHPIIVLTGARQVGKSTLLQHEKPFCNWRYISMDDFDALSQSRYDPSSLWAGVENIVLDEVQKSTNLLSAVKLAVDSNPGKYRFILSGSANLLLMKNVSESLSGRAVYFILLPMTVGEMNNLSPSNLLENLFSGKLLSEKKISCNLENPTFLMWKGFMPSLLTLKTSTDVLRWWEGYVATYLERDLRQLSQIEFLPDFKCLMEALALRCGQILNQTGVARNAGLSQPTAHRYLNLLETTHLIERVPAFIRSHTKRLVKSPKIMWLDSGLVSFLCGHYSSESLHLSKEAGGIFEAMVYLHLRCLCQIMVPRPKIFYWRTTTGKEVDFVLEWGRRLLAIEIKMSSTTKFSDIETLRLFIEEYPETSSGILIYTGDKIKILHEKIVAIPWQLLGGC